MPRVIVTGASGFIGRHIVKKIKDTGYEVIGITKTSSKNKLDIDKVYKIGLSDQEELNNVLQTNDIVLHLAWSSVPSSSESNSEEDVISNIPASLNFIEACTRNKVSHFIFLSSGGTIYGNAEYLPIDEKHPTKPISPYGIDKLMVEKYLHMYSHRFGLPFTILRPSNVYGPNYRLDKGQGVVGYWLESIYKNEPIDIIKGGDIIRDYLHVDDLAELIRIVIAQPIGNQIFNVGTSVGTSLFELLEIIQNLTNREIKLSEVPKRKFDVDTNILSFDKLKKQLNWQPKVDLVEGIKRLV